MLAKDSADLVMVVTRRLFFALVVLIGVARRKRLTKTDDSCLATSAPQGQSVFQGVREFPHEPHEHLDLLRLP
jgi:hypothetical protein